MEFVYSLPVKIVFGRNKLDGIGDICREAGYEAGILVCDPVFARNGLADRLVAKSGGLVKDVFSELSPNPDISEVQACGERIRKSGAKFIVALGGGSAMDCAKAASVTALAGKPVRHFHSEKGAIPGPGLPVIAVPTTAGTGSEVTSVAVLTDKEKTLKLPMASNHMYVKMAIIDPVITLSVPPAVTASTGLDVLSHALEGYWSKNHQPICDATAVYAAKLVFDNLQTAYLEGDNIDAREKMCVASLLAGLAFGPPKTAASHACSFPLTNVYKMPHGEACAFTLDKLVAINCETDGDRIEELARMVGFVDAAQMAARIFELKKFTGMKCTLAEAGIREADLGALAEACKCPNLYNNPTEMTPERLVGMFRELA